jgi:hypothetical protein
VRCLHNACAGRDRLNFLAKMVEVDWLDDSDLINPEFLFGLTDFLTIEDLAQKMLKELDS